MLLLALVGLKIVIRFVEHATYFGQDEVVQCRGPDVLAAFLCEHDPFTQLHLVLVQELKVHAIGRYVKFNKLNISRSDCPHSFTWLLVAVLHTVSGVNMPLEVAVMLFMKLPQIAVCELRSTPRLCVLLAHVRATESLRGDIVNEAVVAVHHAA